MKTGKYFNKKFKKIFARENDCKLKMFQVLWEKWVVWKIL